MQRFHKPRLGAGRRPVHLVGMASARAFRWPFLILSVLLVTAQAAAAADPLDQTPGQRFQIDPAQLPAPYATDSVANSADLVDRPSPPPFHLPPGFSVNEFAGGLRSPRWMAVAPNGDVFLTLPQLGQVLLLRDEDGD